MTTTTPSEDSAAPSLDVRQARKQIIDKASRELRRLDKEEAAIATREPLIQAELEQIRSTAETHANFLSGVQASAAHLRRQAEDARQYAMMAQGTLGEQEAIEKLSALETRMQESEANLQTLEIEHEQATQTENSRLAELAHEQAEGRSKRQEISQARTNIEQVKLMALTDLGEREYADIQAAVVERQQRIEAKRAELLEEQVALGAYLEQEALPRLADFPEHLAKIRALLPPKEDATSRALAAELSYIDTLLTDGRQMNLAGLRPVSGFYNPLQLAVIPAEEIFQDETLRGNPRMLRRRRQLVNEALIEYRSKHLQRT